MANTYTQIHLQVVFAVKYRQALIDREWAPELHRYITGIVQNHQHKMLQINGMPDHVHLLIGLRPSQSLSELMKAVKGDSSAWINENGLTKKRFAWQAGYGAFSYSKSQLRGVIQYIRNQEQHHRSLDLRKEFQDLLEKHEVDFDERYLWTRPE